MIKYLTDFKNLNFKFIYLLKTLFIYLIPKFIFDFFYRILIFLLEINFGKNQNVYQRINYYNMIEPNTNKIVNNTMNDDKYIFINKDFNYILNKRWKYKQKSMTQDFHNFFKYFDKKFNLILNIDINRNIKFPIFCKTRVIEENSKDIVLLNFDYIRHFKFISDDIKFENKKSLVLFCGYCKNETINTILNKNQCVVTNIVEWDNKLNWMSLNEQLKYKFILSIEGWRRSIGQSSGEVATNLKWILSSNSLCFMPKPTIESWFMEDRLIPNYHYVLIKDDLSDIEEKCIYFSNNQEEAVKIIKNANNFCKQFKNYFKEIYIQHKVIEKYFENVR